MYHTGRNGVVRALSARMAVAGPIPQLSD